MPRRPARGRDSGRGRPVGPLSTTISAVIFELSWISRAFASERVGGDRARRAGHDLRRRASVPRSGRRWRRRSPSVTMPARRPSASTTINAAEPLGAHLGDSLFHQRPDAHDRQPVARMHDVADELELGAELAARMEDAEMLRRETALLEERDGKRVAEGELHGGRGRRGKPVRAGLLRPSAGRGRRRPAGRASRRRST